MSIVGSIHNGLVFPRRTRVLAGRLAQLIPARSSVLDVGCGDGLIDRMIMDAIGVSIQGIDTLVRPETQIPVLAFDGVRIPYPDQTFDIVMFVDVLHHTQEAKLLLCEAARVGRNVLIKDHYREGFLAETTLRVMDWVGNAHHGVVLPYNYLSRSEWAEAFQHARLKIDHIDINLGLYPFPFSSIFDRSLHFLAFCTAARK